MNNLLTKCNADVYKAILDIKADEPSVGERLIMFLQRHEYPWQMTLEEINWFAAHLPLEIWNGKTNTFYLLFYSQQTTTMP